jgi:hypothetical protein
MCIPLPHVIVIDKLYDMQDSNTTFHKDIIVPLFG